MTLVSMMVDQIVSLAWIRCCMEEGVDFVNKGTGETERDERKVYEAFENKTGEFDLPKARVSPNGFEKNILEVLGSYLLYNDNGHIQEMMRAADFRTLMLRKIEELRKRV